MTPEEVYKVEREVRDFYFQGQKSLGEYPEKLRRGGLTTSQRQTLRLQRKFADPRMGFSDGELEKLIKTFHQRGHALGPSLIRKLVGVPKGVARDDLIASALEKKWSLERLEAAIRAAGVTAARKGQGRTVRLPDDLDAVLAMVAENCPRWMSRLAVVIPAKGAPPVKLPVGLERELRATKLAVAKLVAIVVRLGG